MRHTNHVTFTCHCVVAVTEAIATVDRRPTHEKIQAFCNMVLIKEAAVFVIGLHIRFTGQRDNFGISDDNMASLEMQVLFP